MAGRKHRHLKFVVALLERIYQNGVGLIMDRMRFNSFPKEKKKGSILRNIRMGFLLAIILAGAGLFCYRNGIGFYQNGPQKELSHPRVEDSRSEEQIQADFEAFTEQIFMSEVTEDSLTLHFTLKNPKDYGIEGIEPTLGDYSLSDFQDSIMASENWLASLEGFDYKKLTSEQKLTYDILHQVLQTNLKSSDLLEYAECLGPTTGIQAQLPVLLAEYSFYTEEDVKDYLELLRQIPDYFEQIIAFEQKKSEKGLFMSDTTAQAIIDQCQEFIAESEDNYLIVVFGSKLKSLEKLSSSQRVEYKKQNKAAVLECVIPAYQSMVDALTGLKGTGNNKGGLCKLEKGREYYAYLVETVTGSSRSIKEINRLLDDSLRKAQKRMSQIMTESPDAYYDSQDVEYSCTDPVESVDLLREQIAGDFVTLPEDIHCRVKYVDESLEDSLSPAFYLTAPIDDYKENVIYINQSDDYDLSEAFTTIAHESYPGHLYQNAFFQSTNPSPVRSVISTGGYVEGWGTYAELYSYELAGLDKEVAQLLAQNALATLCLYAKADIGVNYLNWSQEKLINYLKDFGFSASQSVTIYDSMIAEPVSYLQYTLGYLEIEALRQRAKTKLGSNFSLKKFHEFFLSVGPVPFLVVQDRLNQWIREQQR